MNNMKTYKSLVLGFSCVWAAVRAQSQGNFGNLGFEAANLPPIPAGQYGGPVSSTDAMPGWTAFLGTNQVTLVLHNNLTLGNASVDIIGPNWNNADGIIEGEYTIVLQPGRNPFTGISGDNVSASISQVGLVPANAQSIQFKAAASSSLSVSLGGQNLAIISLGTGPNYTLYGADISPFAGQVRTLAITALAAPNTTDYFDSIVFSPQAVPEPCVFGLLAVGSLLLGRRLRRKVRM